MDIVEERKITNTKKELQMTPFSLSFEFPIPHFNPYCQNRDETNLNKDATCGI
jgi:hypothetical protein